MKNLKFNFLYSTLKKIDISLPKLKIQSAKRGDKSLFILKKDDMNKTDGDT